MPKCYHCGRETSEIHYCSKCGQYYCILHKEPINHECSIVIESLKLTHNATRPTYNEMHVINSTHSTQRFIESTDSVIRGTTDGTYTWYRQEKLIPDNAFDADSGIEFKGIFLSHKSEFIHFLIGIVLIFIVGVISFFRIIDYGFIWALFMLAGFYATAFLFHELGHRQVAIHFGLQTKFRLLTFGMVLTIASIGMGLYSLITVSSPLPSLALPGAVVVLGLDKISKKTGLCKAAGPAVNLIYGSILLITSYLIPTIFYPLNYFIGIAAYFNFMLGTFNMLPFGILDGQNIWKWNKKVYLLLMSTLLILLIFTLISIYAPVDRNPYIPF
jgi:Zn-dependent protease